MDEPQVILIRGWVETSQSNAVTADVLGADAVSTAVTHEIGAWQVVDRLTEEEPVARIRSIVRFTTADAEPATVSFVPGSQGIDQAPSASSRSIASVTLTRGRALLLDARCWFRVDSPSASVDALFPVPRAASLSR
ncbi:hypothetical protein [Catellatospora sp. NPDC049609]|uniref:hypothetical protein n=1 Tax=Catellatospora sp. NPDC049609 TaxID=3155505 RepID=UPI003447072E